MNDHYAIRLPSNWPGLSDVAKSVGKPHDQLFLHYVYYGPT